MSATLAQYVEAQIARARADRRMREEMRLRALEVAKRSAALLRQRFGATRVRLFGSTLRPGEFHGRSDLDLAAEGVIAEQYLAALATLQSEEREFEMDLLIPGLCPPELWRVLEREGIDI